MTQVDRKRWLETTVSGITYANLKMLRKQYNRVAHRPQEETAHLREQIQDMENVFLDHMVLLTRDR